MDHVLVREAIHRDPSLQKFLKWSILPQADVIRGRCLRQGDDRRCTIWRGPPLAPRSRNRDSDQAGLGCRRSTMADRIHNCAVMSTRGEHLMRGGLLFVNGSGLLGRLFARSFAFVLDQIEDRLAVGGIEVTLPDGSRRRIGFQPPGRWRSCISRAGTRCSPGDFRSVGWYRAWAKGEWSAGPGAAVRVVHRQCRPLGDTGRAKGSARMLNWSAPSPRQCVWQARQNIAAHYDLGNDFYVAWLDPTMTYRSARFATPDEGLEQAQLRKMHLLLDRLDLKAGADCWRSAAAGARSRSRRRSAA